MLIPFSFLKNVTGINQRLDIFLADMLDIEESSSRVFIVKILFCKTFLQQNQQAKKTRTQRALVKEYTTIRLCTGVLCTG